jgi:hypothetical protein
LLIIPLTIIPLTIFAETRDSDGLQYKSLAIALKSAGPFQAKAELAFRTPRRCRVHPERPPERMLLVCYRPVADFVTDFWIYVSNQWIIWMAASCSRFKEHYNCQALLAE